MQAVSRDLAEPKRVHSRRHLGFKILETRFPVCENESNISMAEGGDVPELGGYDYEFTSKVPDYWECLVCQLTLKYPVQIEECGHRLCKICIESLLR